MPNGFRQARARAQVLHYVAVALLWLPAGILLAWLLLSEMWLPALGVALLLVVSGCLLWWSRARSSAQAGLDCQRLFDQHPLALWLVDSDLSIRRTNAKARALSGGAQYLTGLFNPIYRGMLETAISDARSGVDAAAPHEMRLALDDRAVNVLIRSLPEAGADMLMVAAVDLSLERQAKALQDVSDRQLHELASRLPQVFWIYDVARGRMEYISPRYESLVGRSAEAMLANPEDWMQSLVPEDRQWVQAMVQRGDRVHQETELEYRIRRPDGSLRWIKDSAYPITDAEGRSIKVAGIMTDVTDSRNQRQRLWHLAHHDQLTDLANRVLLRQQLRKWLDDGRHGVILLWDLDRFKNINDTLGHQVGDQILQQQATRLKETFGQEWMVARPGGDEFVLARCGDISEQALEDLLGQLRQIIIEPIMLDGDSHYLTASVGVVRFPEQGDDPEELLRRVDVAMYAAKTAGRDSVRTYSVDLVGPELDVVRMENRLRTALDNDEFLLHFQPQFAISPPRMSAVEALIRWRRDDELVSPGQFIPLLEETSLIRQVGRWVIDAALAQLAQWHKTWPRLSMAVNLSAQQFEDEGLEDYIAERLEHYGIAGEFLEIELTESTLVREPVRATGFFQKLRQYGVRMAVDDFGTGYSSLAHLHQFAPQVLKLDQRFVQSMSDDPKAAVIVRNVIAMAHGLGMEVVAEGVEDAQPLALLKDMGCDWVQGYYLSRPVPADKLAPEAALARLSAVSNAAVPSR